MLHKYICETKVIQYVVWSDTFLHNFHNNDLVVGVTKHFCVVRDSLILLIINNSL